MSENLHEISRELKEFQLNFNEKLSGGTHKYGGPTMVGNGISEGAPVDFQANSISTLYIKSLLRRYL